jgi:hypothetical protein
MLVIKLSRLECCWLRLLWPVQTAKEQMLKPLKPEPSGEKRSAPSIVRCVGARSEDEPRTPPHLPSADTTGVGSEATETSLVLERDELGVTLVVTCDDGKWNVVKRSKRVSRMSGVSPLIRQ